MLSKGKLLFLGILSVVILAGLFHENSTGQIGLSISSLTNQDKSSTIEVKEAAAGDKFHRNVIQGAIKAKRAGKITFRELRKIRVAMLSPAFRAEAKKFAEFQMLASGEADKIPRIGENIDWDALLAFIERLIPLILQLIDIISQVAYSNPVDMHPHVDFDLHRKLRRIDSSRYHQTVVA